VRFDGALTNVSFRRVAAKSGFVSWKKFWNFDSRQHGSTALHG
jgi:hypothetical protein